MMQLNGFVPSKIFRVADTLQGLGVCLSVLVEVSFVVSSTRYVVSVGE